MFGCTPLSIDDWESFEYAKEEQELLDTEKSIREAKERDQVEFMPLSDCYPYVEIFLENKEDDLCQE